MKKYVFLALVLLAFSKGFSQNEVLKIPLKHHPVAFENKDILTMSNIKTGELAFYIESTYKTKVLLLSPQMKILSEFQIESLPSSFKTYIGYQINSDGSYSIFFTNNSNKKYGILTINFNSKSGNTKTLDFKLKKEVYAQSISHNNKFYLMSVTKNSNNVNFYDYENGTFIKHKILSFDFLEEKGVNGYSRKASYFLKKGLVKIDNTIPNGIETTSEPNKLYMINNNFVFTFDNKGSNTEVLAISPDDFKMNLVEYSKPNIGTKNEFTNHNSFIYDNKIFQIKSSSSTLKFEIKDFETKAILKEIQLAKEDSITFKNTPIIQEGSAFGADREMEKTSKFLRKISQGDIGISVYKQNDLYKITLGSEIIINNGGGGMAMGGFGGMPMGGFPIGGGFVGLSFNPTFFAYNGYSSTKITHIDCLFDEEFKHIEGEVSNNIFDKIKDYEDSLVKDIEPSRTSPASKGYQRVKSSASQIKPKLTNVFEHKGVLYFSYLDTEDRNYHIVEFQQD